MTVVKNYLRNTIARLEQASFGALVTITDDKRKARIYKIKTELAFADKTTVSQLAISAVTDS